jgi:hypothetical protein
LTAAQDVGLALRVGAAFAGCKAAPGAGSVQVEVAVEAASAEGLSGGPGSVTCQSLAADVEVRLGRWVGPGLAWAAAVPRLPCCCATRLRPG